MKLNQPEPFLEKVPAKFLQGSITRPQHNKARTGNNLVLMNEMVSGRFFNEFME